MDRSNLIIMVFTKTYNCFLGTTSYNYAYAYVYIYIYPKRSRYLWDPRGARGPGSQPGEGPMHAGCTVLAQFPMFFAAAFGCLMLCGNPAIPNMMALYLMG